MYNQLYSAFEKDGETLGSNFDTAWRNLAQNSPGQFLEMQYLYTQYNYYDNVVNRILKKTGYDFDSRGYALKNVVFSRAVHHGAGGAVNVITRALETMNLSTATDEDIIKAIYAESGAVVSTGKKSITEANCTYSGSTADKAIKNAKEYGIYAKYLKYFSGNSTEVQVGVYNRLHNTEPKAALRLLDQYN